MSDLALLHAVIAHARATGWTHDSTQRDNEPLEHRWVRDGVKVSAWAGTLYVNASQVRPANVRQAVNLLVDLDVLPVEFHSAYGASRAEVAVVRLVAQANLDRVNFLVREAERVYEALARAEETAAETRRKAEHLNGPMMARLRHCAADTSSNWERAFTVYPGEARGLVALIDDVKALAASEPTCTDCGHATARHTANLIPGTDVYATRCEVCGPCDGYRAEPSTEEPTRTLTAVERDAEQYIAPVGVYGDGWTDPNAELPDDMMADLDDEQKATAKTECGCGHWRIYHGDVFDAQTMQIGVGRCYQCGGCDAFAEPDPFAGEQGNCAVVTVAPTTDTERVSGAIDAKAVEL